LKYEHDRLGGDQNTAVDFPFDEGNAPPFALLLQFCQDVDRYLSGDSKRVVAVHCKHGKGRTGVAVSCYLMYSRQAATAADAMALFAYKRTNNQRAVTLPSHIRYINYFERFLRDNWWPMRPLREGVVLTLQHVRLTTIPQFDVTGGCDPYFVITGPYPYKVLLYDHLRACNGRVLGFHDRLQTHCDIAVGDRRVNLYGDVKFTFFDWDQMGANEKMFSFWLNTAFIDNYYVCVTKVDCDVAHRDRDNRKFDINFKCELFFKHEAR